ncbi:TIR domain-containing protein [Pseudoalteromonas denitrificans]|jgi:predicted nucleotide-binding protein|uniref:Predicted nucleotide-binding protein containing TIR-like domain-containing protein n=1 Tax=Pseudoalteromonas denitrificans DSM 6059 TaxID=1123010 RepID=A0A1I1IH68_9GAMM|nr:nucleotide-binding protein [Pseudoalteromonas denitrificans]SFC35032.1 Predicted nucleotide-binding protein containing TIR-like domain-containing protein [Pseudoalteromonas denitrificans DSM 6059]
MSIEFLQTDFEKVSYLANLLTAHATGKEASDLEFEKLRHELLSNTSFQGLLPSWLKVHRNLGSFWGFIQPKFGTYADRRKFLAEEFSPALNLLEFGYTVEMEKVEEFPVPQNTFNPPSKTKPKKKIFIVHGRDNESKQELSRYIESLGIEVIILHEQASSGMTIIEKIEHYSNEVDFALVLYTACDHGRGIQETKIHPNNRARQNVVFEHGYLMAKLGRQNVCALVKGEIETPNDISGVVYVALDLAGAWKIEVNKELNACGYNI